MCGMKYINKHTGPAGYSCNCVYIMEELDIDKEIYIKISIDKKESKPVITYSRYGG